MAIDAHNVRRGEVVVFADNEERTIYPLTIRSLRKFVKVIERLTNTSDATTMSDEDIDHMIEAAEIILEKIDPALAADRDRLEDAIDLSVFNKIMNIAMGSSSPEA